MECFAIAYSSSSSSSLSLSTNAGNSNTAKFNPLPFSPLKRSHFSNAPSLWCSSSAASYSGLKLKLSPIRCSLNQNEWVPIPNSKARRGGSGFGAIAGSAVVLAGSLQVGLLFGYWDLFNFHFNNFMNQVFKAFHYPGIVTPAHYHPVHFAVGTVFMLMWTFAVYKWAKTSGAKGPGNVPVCVGTTNYIGSRHAPSDDRPSTGAREGEALPTQQQIVNVSVNVTIFEDGAVPIGTYSNPNPVSTGSIAMVKITSP